MGMIVAKRPLKSSSGRERERERERRRKRGKRRSAKKQRAKYFSQLLLTRHKEQTDCGLEHDVTFDM